MKILFTVFITAIFATSSFAQVIVQQDGNTVSVKAGSVDIQSGATRSKVRSGTNRVDIISNNNNGGSHVSISTGEADQIIASLGAKVERDAITVNLADDILFEFDSDRITDGVVDKLNQIAQLIRAKRKGLIAVRGHTDSIGKPSYNYDLSKRRASSVARWLQYSGGISEAVLRTEGFGSDYPVAPNVNPDGSDNPDGRAKNRRVEIVIQTVSGVKLREPQKNFGHDRVITTNSSGTYIVEGKGNSEEISGPSGSITENKDSSTIIRGPGGIVVKIN